MGLLSAFYFLFLLEVINNHSFQSIAHETEGRMGYIDSEAMRVRGIIIDLVKSNELVKNIATKHV